MNYESARATSYVVDEEEFYRDFGG